MSSQTVTALMITEGGQLETKTLWRDGGKFLNRVGTAYVADKSITTNLMGWGQSDGGVVGLVNAEYPERDPEYWLPNTN